MKQTKVCTGCGKEKPRSEFHLRKAGGNKRNPRCRDCDNSRTRTATPARVIRVRARHRAVAALIERHRTEFEELMAEATESARTEAEALAEDPAAAEHYQPDETVRLRPGPRRAGQDVTERIDVARCTNCATHHDRGHVCPNCGLLDVGQVAS